MFTTQTSSQEPETQKSKLRWWHIPLSVLLLCCMVVIILLGGIVLNASILNAPAQADVIVVLGARVTPEATPTPILERRLDLAYQLFTEGYAPAIIVAGAQGDDEPIPEAHAMKTYLSEKGVPSSSIYTEDQSFNTMQSLENAKAIMDANHMQNALVVSSDYHLWRTLSMCKDLGIPASGAGAQNALTWPVAVTNCLRETLSWIKYLFERYIKLG